MYTIKALNQSKSNYGIKKRQACRLHAPRSFDIYHKVQGKSVYQ